MGVGNRNVDIQLITSQKYNTNFSLEITQNVVLFSDLYMCPLDFFLLNLQKFSFFYAFLHIRVQLLNFKPKDILYWFKYVAFLPSGAEKKMRFL